MSDSQMPVASMSKVRTFAHTLQVEGRGGMMCGGMARDTLPTGSGASSKHVMTLGRQWNRVKTQASSARGQVRTLLIERRGDGVRAHRRPC